MNHIVISKVLYYVYSLQQSKKTVISGSFIDITGRGRLQLIYKYVLLNCIQTHNVTVVLNHGLYNMNEV